MEMGSEVFSMGLALKLQKLPPGSTLDFSEFRRENSNTAAYTSDWDNYQVRIISLRPPVVDRCARAHILFRRLLIEKLWCTHVAETTRPSSCQSAAAHVRFHQQQVLQSDGWELRGRVAPENEFDSWHSDALLKHGVRWNYFVCRFASV